MKRAPQKSKLHPRNKYQGSYHFPTLIEKCPELAVFIKENPSGKSTIDFANPDAVKLLNTALLKQYYPIQFWDIPKGYLCPPIPGRADYMHHLADLLATCNNGKIPRTAQINCLDIGVGANCIYPIVGHNEYAWSFVGSDIDSIAVDSAKKIIANNPTLEKAIEIRLQNNMNHIFKGIIHKSESFDLTICNPPFHATQKEAQAVALRKVNILNKKKVAKAPLNFGGQANELWYPGGEKQFIQNMILESKAFQYDCFWFTTLVSKSSLLQPIYKMLSEVNISKRKTIEMGQGHKISRIVAWTFLSPKQQAIWSKTRFS